MNIMNIAGTLQKKSGSRLNLICHTPLAEIRELVTDSRNHFSPEASLFFAINTPGGNDGHKFMNDLYMRGVRNFVCEYIPKELENINDANFLVVPSSLEALALVGNLNSANAKEIVAITGSRGKTTLKEIIFQLMEPFGKISRSPRSYNSKIGVPLSLWQISENSDLAIIEAGISKKGEMKFLADTIQPHTVIFTNIGDAHANGFSSKAEKAYEKCLLGLAPSVKKVIFPLDDPFLAEALSPFKGNREFITWSLSNPDADVFVKKNESGVEFTYQGSTHQLETSIEKDFDICNIAAALTFMLARDIPVDKIQERFSKLQHISTRLNVSEGINGCALILDSYTSDMSSLLPAVDFMKRHKMPRQSVTVVMSDLHHEGQSVEDTYREVARIVEEAGISKFIGIGPVFFSHASLFSPSACFFRDIEHFHESVSASDFNDEIILLKNGPEYDFSSISQMLEARRHETVLEVNLDALLRNFNYFRRHIPSTCGIVAMVKASGYGAGSYETARTLQDAGAAYLAVAALDEGVDLRNHGITMPIMVMNPRAANYRALFKNRLQPVIYSFEMLHTLIHEAGKYGGDVFPVHIKLDTGMHRMGFLEYEIPQVASLLQKAPGVKVASVFSHLATADCLDMDEFTLRQIERFEKMSAMLTQDLGYPVKRHILNSAGILRFPEYHYDLVRLGIGLYGANTLPPEIESPLAVVSTLRSVIICIREIEGEEAVGYGRKGKIQGKRRIATVPIGYADGMNRKFGNGAVRVFVNGHYAPTIGNICMDATMIDVTGIPCQEGDSVEIFGENASLQSLADTLDTIPYEVLTSVSPRVKRIYFRE